MLSQQALEFEPGTKWQYSNTGIAALGRIVEVISGQPLEVYMAKRIFEPLGMKDTFFNVPAEKLDRVAQPDPATLPAGGLTDVRQKRTFLGGGEGLNLLGDLRGQIARGGQHQRARVLQPINGRMVECVEVTLEDIALAGLVWQRLQGQAA